MSKPGQAISAGTVIDALATRHAKDVFVPECKMGSAWAGCRILDAWAMSKSWSPWTTFGYEVKVSRSDFLNDRKWQEYLPVCHEFYLATPAKLVAPEELPPDVGLLWMVGGRRMICKRKAVRREPDPAKLGRLMSYVLMSRARIVADMHEANAPEEDARDRWSRWLAEDTGEKWLGRMVGRRLAERVAKAERERDLAVSDRVRFEDLAKQVREWGLDPEHCSRFDLQRLFAPDRARDQRIAQAARSILAMVENMARREA